MREDEAKRRGKGRGRAEGEGEGKGPKGCVRMQKQGSKTRPISVRLGRVISISRLTAPNLIPYMILL